jgi:hypothetical protein
MLVLLGSTCNLNFALIPCFELQAFKEKERKLFILQRPNELKCQITMKMYLRVPNKTLAYERVCLFELYLNKSLSLTISSCIDY